MRTVYIVEGLSVRYDDSSTWLVRAFTSEEKAKAFAAACFAEATRVREAQTNLVKDGYSNDYWAAWRAIPPNCHDPGHGDDYAEYAVRSLPFEASLTTPDYPLWVKITGPEDAYGVTVGRVYRVIGWSADHTRPIIRDDEGHPWALGDAGCVGSRLYPAWEPCDVPAAIKAANGEDPS